MLRIVNVEVNDTSSSWIKLRDGRQMYVIPQKISKIISKNPKNPEKSQKIPKNPKSLSISLTFLEVIYPSVYFAFVVNDFDLFLAHVLVS